MATIEKSTSHKNAEIIQGVSETAQLNNTGRIVPYHTKCDANYSEVDLSWSSELD